MEKIKTVLKGISIKLSTRPEWTAAIKDCMYTVGDNEGFGVCPALSHQNKEEWLYDLIWYKNTDNHTHLKEIILVLESEWDSTPEAIRRDFEKLLVAKAPIKVMIFEKHWIGTLDFLKTGIEIFEQKNNEEVYILAEFIAGPPSDRGFKFHVWNCQAKDTCGLL